jgi:recombination protein RecT
MPRPQKQLHGWREPAPTRPAATILLVRDTGSGLEVLMTRRSSTASFAPGAYVFPGGVVDAADATAASGRLVRSRADQDEAHRPFAAAALREAFEELGVLLAWRGGTDEPCPPALARSLDRATDCDFYAQLQAADLELAVDRSHWLSHWITDRDLPKRFDVRFLVAPMPDGQQPHADGTEQFEPVWVNPADGLARHERGDFNIIFPTIRTLRQLTRFSGVSQLLEACSTQRTVYRSCPRAGLLGDGVERYSEEESPFGELALAAPDGQVVHRLDWQSTAPVRLLANVQRLTAPNPSVMTGPGTNTYIVGEPGGYIVIDPGPALPEHVARIAAIVGGDLAAIVCTHSHPDHSPAVPLLNAAVPAPVTVYGMSSGPGAREHSFFRPDREMADGELLKVGDSTLRAVHTPGHAANHLCLVLEEDRLLFSGDHVLNGSTTVVDPPDGNMLAYIESLRRLAQEPVDFILPAHGYVLGPAKAAIEHLIAHRLGREAKVAAALQQAGEGSLEALVPLAYDDVRPALYPVAMRSLLAHLEKLEADGRARRDGAVWQRVARTA